MRNVSPKPTTLRTAKARAEITASPETLAAILEDRTPKGDPRPVAKVAAVLAAKKTTEWIPYCHNIPIEGVNVEFDMQQDRIVVDVEVISVAKTGVEMEAITAACAAAITIYDMLKMIDDDMEIVRVRLLEKRGGKSDFTGGAWSAGVLVTEAPGLQDQLVQGLQALGADSVVTRRFSTESLAQVETQISDWIGSEIDLVVIASNDRTVIELVKGTIQVELPGVSEQLRRYGQDRRHEAMVLQTIAGIAGRTLMLVLPDSKVVADDALQGLLPGLIRAHALLFGEGAS